MRKTLAIAALTMAIVGLSAGSAFAAEDDYTPNTPPTLTLAGSTAESTCHGDAPAIHYSVVMTDPQNIAKSHTAYLKLSNGTKSVDIKLGELVNNKLSGDILWPGASVDGNGVANGWPGWTQVDGSWVETTGNYAWTRGAITAELHVNPQVVVPLSYPAATSACAHPTGVLSEQPSMPSLAVTGGTISLGAAGVGVAALAVGLGLTLRRRRANR